MVQLWKDMPACCQAGRSLPRPALAMPAMLQTLLLYIYYTMLCLPRRQGLPSMPSPCIYACLPSLSPPIHTSSTGSGGRWRSYFCL